MLECIDQGTHMRIFESGINSKCPVGNLQAFSKIIMLGDFLKVIVSIETERSNWFDSILDLISQRGHDNFFVKSFQGWTQTFFENNVYLPPPFSRWNPRLPFY